MSTRRHGPKDGVSGEDETKTGANEDGDQEKLGPKEYLGYRVLRERELQDSQPTSRSVFWKLCCEVDRMLLEKHNLNIEFPRHWYRYGEVAEVHSLSRGFFNAPQARFWEGQELYPNQDVAEVEFDVTFEERETIRQTAHTVVNRLGKESAESLKRRQYTRYSPNEFVEIYSHLRSHLEASDVETGDYQQGALGDFVDADRGYVENLLDKMLLSYPEDQSGYKDMYRLYLRWDDTMRMLIEQGQSVHEQKIFLELFVEKLSQIVLRFEHTHAIPKDRIEEWKEEKPEHFEELRKGIDDIRGECLQQRDFSGELESISEVYDRVVLNDI